MDQHCDTALMVRRTLGKRVVHGNGVRGEITIVIEVIIRITMRAKRLR